MDPEPHPDDSDSAAEDGTFNDEPWETLPDLPAPVTRLLGRPEVVASFKGSCAAVHELPELVQDQQWLASELEKLPALVEAEKVELAALDAATEAAARAKGIAEAMALLRGPVAGAQDGVEAALDGDDGVLGGGEAGGAPSELGPRAGDKDGVVAVEAQASSNSAVVALADASPAQASAPGVHPAEETSPRWLTRTVPGRRVGALVVGLRPGTRHVFRVAAANYLGYPPFSIESFSCSTQGVYMLACAPLHWHAQALACMTAC
jgi:hypothetical protein